MFCFVFFFCFDILFVVLPSFQVVFIMEVSTLDEIRLHKRAEKVANEINDFYSPTQFSDNGERIAW